MRKRSSVSLTLLSLLIQPSYSPACLSQTKTNLGCAAAIETKKGPEISIDSLEFSNGASIPEELQRTMQKAVATEQRLNPDRDWIDHIGDVARNEAQATGYFKALVEPSSGLIRAEANRLHYWVSLKIDLGQQYRLGQVLFAGGSVFPESKLRSQIPIEEGGLFSVTKVREGLENLRRLYVRTGYIDFTAEPQTDIDEDAHRIDLTLHLNEERQYRLRTLEVRGFDSPIEEQLRNKFEAGQVFDGTAIHEFFQSTGALLPPDVREENNVRIALHAEDGTVSLTFDRHACASLPPSSLSKREPF